jgi:hypothetical protein
MEKTIEQKRMHYYEVINLIKKQQSLVSNYLNLFNQIPEAKAHAVLNPIRHL